MSMRLVRLSVIMLLLGACVSPGNSQGRPAISTRSAAAAAGEWEDWYLPTDDGCTLYVKEVGRGAPLVVLHGGWGAEHSYLLDAFEGLESSYRLVFYDQRGSLRSPCPDSLVSVDSHVADLEHLRNELGLDRMKMVGHSMGTFLAMSYLQAHPDRVAGLVLLGSLIPRAPQDDRERSLYQREQQAFVEFARAAEAAEIAEEGLEGEDLTAKERTRRWRIGYAAGNLYHVDRWRQLRGGQVFFSDAAGRAAGETMSQDWNFVPALEQLEAPVTVINGDHDLVGFGGELHRVMLADLAGVEFVLIEQAGHVAWIDQPRAFEEQLMQALEREGPN